MAVDAPEQVIKRNMLLEAEIIKQPRRRLLQPPSSPSPEEVHLTSWLDRPPTPSLSARPRRQGSGSLDLFRTGMAAFARAMRCVICLRASFSAAWRRAWSGPRGSRSMRASSPPTPTSSARFQARIGTLRNSRKTRLAPRAEYLATLDDAAFGAASPVTPKFISPQINQPRT